MESIIVYRNPVEAAFWDIMLNGGGLQVFLVVIALGVQFVVLHSLIEKILHKTTKLGWRANQVATNLSAVLVVLTAIAILFFA